MTPSWKTKPGVILSGHNPRFTSEPQWEEVARLIQAVAKAVPVVTSAMDGQHSAHTLHTRGDAVDVRVNDWKCDVETLARAIAWALGGDWVVVMEPDHLHIQLGTENIVGLIEYAGAGWFIKSKRCK